MSVLLSTLIVGHTLWKRDVHGKKETYMSHQFFLVIRMSIKSLDAFFGEIYKVIQKTNWITVKVIHVKFQKKLMSSVEPS